MTTENTENTTSQVSHSGDSTTQHTKHDTGVGSDCWFGLDPSCLTASQAELVRFSSSEALAGRLSFLAFDSLISALRTP